MCEDRTSRTQGRDVYYRLTQPELGALLQAAAQLHAPTGQQAAEEKDRTVRKTQPDKSMRNPAGTQLKAASGDIKLKNLHPRS